MLFRSAYRAALAAARDVDQIKAAADQLSELGEKVDLPAVFGFVNNWQLIGPFDNRNDRGFDVAYPPEKRIDLQARYQGLQSEELAWKPHASDDKYGIVDLNKALGKHKGAVGYAYAEFYASQAQPVELRLGCIKDRKSTRLNSSHSQQSRMPSSA